ncbi:extracellular solute-binding protein [Jeotgalibaca caeni]|uniref:extracellular solute-binding protein n=1 Tax=Jeotgalibaca caeni TaxID=3028623 RepID=UPI00237DDC16|nr:extracellular solute-binding protein [Jeotgalibaca caeni]MDE1549688.1 extracellular solute-binding protein [Jeotgalibaca caeni]
MDSKKVNKFGKVLLGSFFVLSALAACNSTGGNEGASDNANENQSSNSGVANTDGFSEEVTLRVPVYDRGVEGVPTVDDNYWTNWIQEEFGDPNNINVEFVPITRQDVMTDYALLASSQDLPTILMEYDYPKVTQWANEGYLTTFDLNDFKEVAPTYYAQMEEEGQLDFTEMDGETYFTLAKRPYWASSYNFQQFYRKDWLEEVGYDEYPTTYKEYEEAMLKIQEAGLAEHPLGGAIIAAQGADVNIPFMDYPIDEKEWATYASAVLPPLGYEPSREYLRRENSKYNQGLLHPEYYITDLETQKARFINGETFVFGEYISSNSDTLNSFYENNPDAELAIVPMTGEDPEAGTSAAYMSDNPFGMIVGFSSQATEEELQAAWMYMEWMAQEETLETMQWGIEGENYTINEETQLPESVGDYEGEYKQGFNNNKDYWAIVVETRMAGTLEDMIAAVTPKGLPKDFTQEVIDVTKQKQELAKEGYAVNFPAYSVPIESEIEYMGTLQQLYTELRDTIVMSDPAEFDKLYDEYSEQYLEAGFQEIIEERAKAYEDGKSTKKLGPTE